MPLPARFVPENQAKTGLSAFTKFAVTKAESPSQRDVTFDETEIWGAGAFFTIAVTGILLLSHLAAISQS